MREKRASVVIFEVIDVTQEQFDQPIFWLLAALLAYMPAAFGCWDPWSESIAQAGACGLAILLAVKLTRRSDVRFVWSWTFLPIALFFLLAFVQLISWPAALVGAISPKTVTTNHAFLDDLPDAAQRLRFLHFSFYPEGVWHDLRNLFSVTCVYIVVINVFRRSEQIIRLLWVIAWVATAEGLLSILQNLTGTHDIYWLVSGPWGDANGGTFPNHNCFAQYMNLGSGAIVGLLLLKIDGTFRRHDYAPAEVIEKLGSLDFRPAYLLLLMLTITLSSVFLSLSRGGMLAIAVAGITVGVLLALRGGARGMGIGGWLAGVILVGVFSLVMVGGANLVQDRIARIGNPEDQHDRFQLTKDAFRSWKDYPAIGMGLGGFRYTFPSYDHSDNVKIATHAEDEYVQLLQETGVAGAVIAGTFVLMIFANFMRARPRRHRNQVKSGGGQEYDQPEDDPAPLPGKQRTSRRRHGKRTASPASSLALGTCFGLVSILVQSAVDFGQHCISIACLSAISCALLVNLASLRRREHGVEPEPTPVCGWRPVRATALVAVVIVSALLLIQANSVRLATAAYVNEDHLARQLESAGWKGDSGDFIDMNRFADESVRYCPGNLTFQYWRVMNGFNTISDVRDPNTGDVILTDEKLRILKGLVSDAQNARWSCPLFGPLYCQLGQWEQNSLGQFALGDKYIRMAFELSPGDDVVCFVMGMLEAEEGHWPQSIGYLRRSEKLKPAMWEEGMNMLIGYFHRPDMAVELAGDDVEQLRNVASALRGLGKDPALGPTTGPATQPADETLALKADEQADKLVRASADRPDASSQQLGEMGLLCDKLNDGKGAAHYLGRALSLDYSETDWRMIYARNLAKIGRTDDAIHQAQIVLRERPQMQEAQDLLYQLNGPSTQPIDELYR
jgi:O-antigen ligase/tetratricopeptide (TPR) repeat protein